MKIKTYTLPRLWVDQNLALDAVLILPEGPAHYLKNVMRVQPGEQIRIFNARAGEFVAEVGTHGKRETQIRVRACLRGPEVQATTLHAIFPPFKKARADDVTSKITELGVTHVHPVLTQHTEVREVNAPRVTAQLVEASEQCERLSLPLLSPLGDLPVFLAAWDQNVPIYAGVERVDARPLASYRSDIQHARDVAVLVGPAGGWSDVEKEMLQKHPAIRAVSLGADILRADTALIAMLSFIKFTRP